MTALTKSERSVPAKGALEKLSLEKLIRDNAIKSETERRGGQPTRAPALSSENQDNNGNSGKVNGRIRRRAV